jgi:hypothetical protein
MGPVKVKPNSSYIRRCPIQTDEYNFIFVGFETNEYNLNIFVGTNEYKKPMNEYYFSVVLEVVYLGRGRNLFHLKKHKKPTTLECVFSFFFL